MIDVPLVELGLLLVRPGALIVAAPAFGSVYAPAPVKIGLTVLIALALLPIAPLPSADSPVALAGIVAREFAIGIALGLAVRVFVAAAELGGHLIGFQMGLSYGAIIDPQTGVRNNLLAALYGNLAILMFLLTNAHHAFLYALRDSYSQLPVGSGQVHDSVPEIISSLLGMIFTLGVRLAAPVLVVLVLTELAMALMARSAPSLNLMADGSAVRLIVGLLLLGLVAPAAVGVLGSVSGSVVAAGVRAAEAFR